jgi:hypothetical protein
MHLVNPQPAHHHITAEVTATSFGAQAIGTGRDRQSTGYIIAMFPWQLIVWILGENRQRNAAKVLISTSDVAEYYSLKLSAV